MEINVTYVPIKFSSFTLGKLPSGWRRTGSSNTEMSFAGPYQNVIDANVKIMLLCSYLKDKGIIEDFRINIKSSSIRSKGVTLFPDNRMLLDTEVEESQTVHIPSLNL